MNLRTGSDDPFAAGTHTPIAEVNVTPLVDVVLVLLIIFMVTAPLLVAGIPVQLPATTAARLAEPPPPILVVVDEAGRLYLQNQEVAEADLPARLALLHEARPEAIVEVHGDRAIAYGRVVAVMDLIAKAGIRKVSLASHPRAPES